MRDDDRYELRDDAPTVDGFQRLRAVTSMSERSRTGVERGLPNSCHAVRIVDTAADPAAVPVDDGEVVGMARVVGDVHESEALVRRSERGAF